MYLTNPILIVVPNFQGSNPEYTDLLNPDFNLVVARKMAELHLVSPSEVTIPVGKS